jgi:hypothetical protein
MTLNEKEIALVKAAMDFGWEMGFSGSARCFSTVNSKDEQAAILKSFIKTLKEGKKS